VAKATRGRTHGPAAYEAVRYAADGCAGEQFPSEPHMSDGAILARGSLDECRAAVARVLIPRLYAARAAGELHTPLGRSTGPVLLRHLRWSGRVDDDDQAIEAYHDDDSEGCGGWAIRPAR
jgi:hypothetical protein